MVSAPDKSAAQKCCMSRMLTYTGGMDIPFSPHFTLSELTHSQTAARRGIDNRSTEAALANLRDMLCPGLEQVRACWANRS